jgi:glutamine amidotransferase-like uncharacterized protein
MEKKVVKHVKVKASIVKTLKDKLMTAVHNVLKENNTELKNKIQKVIEKSVKKIVKKNDQQVKKALKSK